MVIALVATATFAAIACLGLAWIDVTDSTRPFDALSLYLVALPIFFGIIAVLSPFLMRLENTAIRRSTFLILTIAAIGVLIYGESTFGLFILGPLIAALISAAFSDRQPEG